MNKMQTFGPANNLFRFDADRSDTAPIRELSSWPRRYLDFDSILQAPNSRDGSSANNNETKNFLSKVAPIQAELPKIIVNGTVRQQRHVPAAPSFTNYVPCPDDRFVPRRRGINEFTHFFHTRKDEKKDNKKQIDVLGELKKATEHWRRKYMHETFLSLNVFPGLESQRVLRIGNPSAAEAGKRARPDITEDYQWDCRPRKQPLMNLRGESSKRYRDHGAQIFRFAVTIKLRNVLDWSSKNVLAAGLYDTMCICDVDFKNHIKMYRIDSESSIFCLKWNPPGTQILVSCNNGRATLYDIEEWDIVWTQKCLCNPEIPKKCKIHNIVWTKIHRHIITVCTKGNLQIIKPSTGHKIRSVNFGREVVNIALSPAELYLAVSTNQNLVKIHNYPSLQLAFEIQFFSYVRSFAWHPWTPGILCIGGGPGDGSISLWNVNRQQQLGYRKVDFCASVENLMFNQLSGELLVHWCYLSDDRLRGMIVVLSDLETIVDCAPVQPEHRMLNIFWNADNTRVAMQHRDTLVIWNFFGASSAKWQQSGKNIVKKDPINNLRNYSVPTKSDTGPFTAWETARRGKDFKNYIIR